MDTIEEVVKQAPWGSGKLIKKYIDVFTENKLEQTEQLIDVAVPAGRPTDLLFVTDWRIFYFKMNSENKSHDKIVPYQEIHSVELDGNEEKADIKVSTTQGVIIVSQVLLPIAEKVQTSINQRILK